MSSKPNQPRAYDIVAFDDFNALSDQKIDDLIRHEREVYGYESFGEYCFCTNDQCRRIQSIDEVYGVKDTSESYKPLAELEQEEPKTPCCPECQSETLLIFDPLYFRDYLKEVFNHAYGSFIVDEKGRIQGSNLVKTSTIKTYFDEMNYKRTFDWDHFVESVKHVLNIDVEKITRMITLNRISIARQFRGGETLHRLLRDALNRHPEFDELPVFGTTRFESALYPIVRSIGFKTLATDISGSVSMGNERMGNIREIFNLDHEAFKTRFKEQRAVALTERSRLIPPPEGAKFYQKSPLLDRFYEIAKSKK